jgi:hypothetical protein
MILFSCMPLETFIQAASDEENSSVMSHKICCDLSPISYILLKHNVILIHSRHIRFFLIQVQRRFSSTTLIPVLPALQQQVFQHPAVASDQIGQDADNRKEETEIEENGAQNKGLDMAASIPGDIVIKEADTDSKSCNQ